MAQNRPPRPGLVIIGVNGQNENLWGKPGQLLTPAQRSAGYRPVRGGGGGTTSASQTASQLEADKKAEAAWRRSLYQSYRVYVHNSHAAIPKWLKNLKWDKETTYSAAYIKLLFEEHDVPSRQDDERVRNILKEQLISWGIDVKDPEIKAALDRWVKKYDVEDITPESIANFVHRYLRNSAEFKRLFPGYNDWAENYMQGVGQGAVPTPDEYLKYVGSLKDAWFKIMGQDASLDNTWIVQAIALGWTIDRFSEEIRNSDDFKNTAGQKYLTAQFDGLWDGLFAGTRLEKYKEELSKKFRLSGLEFDKWFDLYLWDNAGFKAEFLGLYPEFEAYHDKMTSQYPGQNINIETFIERRTALFDIYQDTLEDYDGVIPPELLSRAISEGWTNAHLENYLKTNPEFRDKFLKTAGAKADASDFISYWKGIFGTDSAVDTGLLADYIVGGSGDPTTFFDKIRQTSEFQAQYGMWDDFAASQNAAGQSGRILADPALYKDYLQGGIQAFANYGLNIDEGYLRNFFRSGLTPQTLDNNLNEWNNNRMSFDWQTGQPADLTTAAGIGDKKAGGDLRIRMKQAIEQHKTFAESRFKEFASDMKQGMLAKKI